MNFDELQDYWNTMHVTAPTEEETLKMTHPWNNPRIRRMAIELIAESLLILLVAVDFIYLTAGHSASFWLIVAFITGSALVIITDCVGFSYLVVFPNEKGIRTTMVRFARRMTTLILFTRVGGAFMMISMIIAGLTSQNGTVIFLSVAPIVMVTIWMITRKWTWRLADARQTIKELDGGFTNNN